MSYTQFAVFSLVIQLALSIRGFFVITKKSEIKYLFIPWPLFAVGIICMSFKEQWEGLK